MCGIFGYIGDKKTGAKIVIGGLKTLEYRGYDSWGIAVGVGKKLIIEKQVGKIRTAKTNLPQSHFGIGHTRWATHGGVTDLNAHPHLSCNSEIAVVHNGIVENYQDIKRKLGKNHKIKSETDTEIIAHLIEEENKEKGFVDAVRSAFRKLKGLNAVVVSSSDGQIAVAKKGSPIVLGIGNGEYFIASDPAAILPYTKKVTFLEDNQLALVANEGVKVFEVGSGKEMKPKIQILDWEVEEAQLGKFKHFMLKEIFEQPGVMRNCAENLEGSLLNSST